MALTVFGAQSSSNDIELWGTDGTTGRTSLIKNINPSGNGNVGNAQLGSSGGSMPFAVVGNYAYFSADDGVNGQELWRTDGTTGLTEKMTEFYTTNGTADTSDDTKGYNPTNIVAANGYIFFVGSGPDAVASPGTSLARYGIWRYNPASPASAPTFISGEPVEQMIAVGNRVYWTFNNQTVGMKSSDGVGAVETHHTGSIQGSGAPFGMYDAGGTVYLAYNGGTLKVQGVTETTVTGGPTQPTGFIHTSSHVYIIGQSNNTLYVTTTGSSTATQITHASLTFDFSYNPGFHTPGFAALGNKLVFSNNKTGSSGFGASTGSEVWITDGTGAGTGILKDIVAGTGSSNPHNFITVGSSVFFQATNGNGSVELWKTDGTGVGTIKVDTLFGGGMSSGSFGIVPPGNLENLSVVNGLLYFSFDDGIHGPELWRSDGTAAGTLMVKELNTGSFDSSFSISTNSYGISLGSVGVFIGWSQASGYELFATNGLQVDTGLLKDIDPGGGNSLPSQFTLVGNKAFFSAYTPTAGVELWITDGTSAGTQQVKDINPGLGSSNAGGMVTLGNRVWFSADNGTNGSELWVSDGTSAGTYMIADIDPTTQSGFPRSGSPGGFVATGSNVFFTASTFAGGRELWVTDGTSAGTHVTKEIGTGAADANIYSNIIGLNGKAYFQATSSGSTSLGSELWVSDGTSGGTMVLKDLNTSPNGTGGTESSNPTDLILVNGKIFFRAGGLSPFSGNEIYVSDGTQPGTFAVTPTLTNFSQFAVSNNNVFFTAQGASGQELYVTSGTAATVIDIVGGASGSNASNPVAFGSKVLFSAADTISTGQELWISDGTLAGTQLVKNINTNPSAGSNPQYMTVVGSKAFFVANDGSTGQELWVTDGTFAGTQLVKNIGPGSTNGGVFPLRAMDNSHLLFWANDGVNGTELWITDGTTAGTFRATNVIQPSGGFYSGSGSGTLNGGGTPSGTFTSVPGVTLGAGSEIFDGNTDDEYFDGLGGVDTLVFAGKRGDYLITDVGNGSITFADMFAGRDGTDLARNIESYQFSDRTVAGSALLKATFASATNWLSTPLPAVEPRHVGDFNGDGRDDIFRFIDGVSGAQMYLSNGSAFTNAGSWTGSGNGNFGWHVGDFNGDGRDDIFRYLDGVSGAEVHLSNGTSFVQSGSWTGQGNGNFGWHIGDFNGDGKDDIFRYVDGVSGAQVFLSNGSSFVFNGSWSGAGNGNDGWHLGDFNGDGKDDIFRYVEGFSGAEVFLSNGSSFVNAGSWTGAGSGNEGWYIADYNGDGRDDLLRYVDGVSGGQVFLSNGSAFHLTGSWTGAGNGSDGWYPGDYNGDSTADLLRFLPTGADVLI